MILTFTPNPATDITLSAKAELQRGKVQRLSAVTTVAGGKGINVSHAISLAGQDTLALFPAGHNDPFLALMEEARIPYKALTVGGQVRSNIAVTEPDGITTKLNGPGAKMDNVTQAELEYEFMTTVGQLNPEWVVLAGSLPPGVDTFWYVSLIHALRVANPETKIALDTSDEPMQALGKSFETTSPTIIKPNGIELGQLVGVDGSEIEARAKTGDYAPVVAAAELARKRGVADVLVTLGSAGAVLVTAAGAWIAEAPPAKVVSTVGAGDSALAGYLMAQMRGEEPAECLRHAVAYGTVAASLPGTTIPTPDLLDLLRTRVTPFTS
ncbi:1-phosphofructokinase family hexose kinase [Corynebacterium caspium]|uniref:1-phosphofructokinase family hexose kinase n=1 Tax=Corynebacterium caspium TaxID=234828 RepID=UPI00036AE8D1|nr:1-phosphofructokinase family hexose kinase [Corynebacterium caspium]WKD59126.1 Tagatose-6-phosphate kinase [Corynebacterium caspium DSM 44850]